ncbi:MAG: Gmad2 immunoglobulin-like domain-containing protein, partial [Chloroflexota bacterium]
PAPTQEPSATASDLPSGEPSPSASAPASTVPGETMIVRTYFVSTLANGGNAVIPVLRTVPKTTGVATAAMTALLAGTVDVEWSWDSPIETAIPQGTTLVGVAVDGTTATVTLSPEWKAAAGTFDVGRPMEQIVYTLTQFSTIKKVIVATEDGSTSAALGRADFRVDGLLQPIFLDRPAFNAAFGNPGKISGVANVFEATFRIQLLNAKGQVIADQQVMASCGTGCWGSFKADVPYTVTKGQYGTLKVFDLSAKDGTPENEVSYRVWLTPGA